ncbi:ribosomal protein S18 acetylase RimI-like enzyme [Saccharothrix tamanrassetensis]|uniref:Ribosomal protein S18 acetylase RimI-like enzyme n=1 Tax=Saccharothrix tamanrassetensis TaxID=1051531 RepID=A0A841CBG0_9PSEU|nr:GNAT family N-acetyltransferase [Saccharothrix tamanrassetensis]MBB5955852.1 ribosomal protein S18 acetylase RimI-like enzyme [Saccharothrix tamanrassetensis]
MNLRRLSPADWATWRDLRLTALASDPQAFGSALSREQDYDESRWREVLHPRWGVKVVAEAPEPVGLVAGVPHEDHDDVLYLYSMWVKPRFRRRGVGEALVAEVLAWAREHGWRRVQLRVFRGNVAARRLYERLGFTGEGEVMNLAVS